MSPKRKGIALRLLFKDWRELYWVAIEFNKLRPWTWMSDSDLFGVENLKAEMYDHFQYFSGD